VAYGKTNLARKCKLKLGIFTLQKGKNNFAILVNLMLEI
jgi:hypothetical protein